MTSQSFLCLLMVLATNVDRLSAGTNFDPILPEYLGKSIQGFRYYVQMCLLCICLYVNILYAINVVLNLNLN